MKAHVPRDVMLAILIGLVSFLSAPGADAQQAPPSQGSGQPEKVSDTELKAFAKAYVEYQRIRQRYEAALDAAKDPAEKKKIQQEGNLKVKEAVEKQGLSVESYNRIFTNINADEALRQKALKLIDEERARS